MTTLRVPQSKNHRQASVPVASRPFSELTRTVFGEPLSMDSVAKLIGLDPSLAITKPAIGRRESRKRQSESGVEDVWVGSIGYERYKLNQDFAQRLRIAHVECLIDVRELPISRRRGFAKTALSEALKQVGIEYLHIKALGNPKEFRDLYKSGSVRLGREKYRQFLVRERMDDLRALLPLLTSRRCVLMCVEHDEASCHRSVIFDTLARGAATGLNVVRVGTADTNNLKVGPRDQSCSAPSDAVC